MPIHPSMKELYPKNWPAISKRIRFERAGNRCEWCDAENYKPHSQTGSRVVLTVWRTLDAHRRYGPCYSVALTTLGSPYAPLDRYLACVLEYHQFGIAGAFVATPRWLQICRQTG